MNYNPFLEIIVSVSRTNNLMVVNGFLVLRFIGLLGCNWLHIKYFDLWLDPPGLKIWIQTFAVRKTKLTVLVSKNKKGV